MSPCTIASTFGLISTMAASISDGVKTVPHSRSITCTSAWQRSAISRNRLPKRPKIGTSTRSPGSSRLTSAASMPARLVPSMSRVAAFAVQKTPRYSSIVSFM